MAFDPKALRERSVSTGSPTQAAASHDPKNLGGPFNELAAALAAVGMGLWEIDGQNGPLRLSDAAGRLIHGGGASDSSLEQTLSRMPLPAREGLRAELHQLVQHGVPVELDLPLAGPEGGARWVQLRGRRLDPASGSLLCRGTVHDTTRLREHDVAASDGAERYRLLVERTHEMVAEFTLDGRFCYANPGHEQILGWKPGELLGTSAFALIHPDDVPRIRARFQGDHANDIYRFRHEDGSWRWLESTGSRFTTANGEERGVVISRDVTARRQAEEDRVRLESQLRHAQKMETLGTLAGGIAHDFNNILGVILAYAELSKMDLSPADPVQTSLDQIMQAGLRAKDLVQQILVFSRQQQLERRPMCLTEPLHDALELFRASRKQPFELSVQLLPDAPAVLADPAQIRQVVLNLCSNAALALPAEGGRIEVRLDRVDGRVEPRGRLGPLDYARITVRDSGCGMDPGTVMRVFDPFFTTRAKGEGSGLGLSVVQGVVKSHGGLVLVDSCPGQGSTFEVFFPRFAGPGAK